MCVWLPPLKPVGDKEWKMIVQIAILSHLIILVDGNVNRTEEYNDSTQSTTSAAEFGTNRPLSTFENGKISWLQHEGLKQGEKVLTLGYLIPWTREWEVGPSMGAAILLGLREIQRRQLLPDYKIKWVWRDAYCRPSQAMKMAVEMWKNVEHLDAIIGDGCSVGCNSVGLLAAVWQMPMISWACNGIFLSDKDRYPTFTRISYTFTKVVPVVTAMMGRFNWTQNIVIVRGIGNVGSGMTNAFLKDFARDGITVTVRILKSTVKGQEMDYGKEAIFDIKRISRVVIIFLYGTDFRHFLITCQDYGLFNGDYVFIAYDHAYLLNSPALYRPEITNDLYNGIINIAPTFPSGPAWDRFAEEVIQAFQHPAFDDVNHLGPEAQPDQVDGYAGMVHDAVLMWGYGVNKTIAQGHNPSDGVKVTENILNLVFQGITGTVVIDHLGDRKPNFKVEIFQNQKLITLMTWDAVNEVLIKSYRPNEVYDWSGLLWPGNTTQIPRDSPECGWKGEFCETEDGQSNMLTIAIATTVLFALIFTAIVTMIVRKLRFESEIKGAISCLVQWKDVTEDGQNVFPDSTSFVSGSYTLNENQTFIKTVRYNDHIAAIKPLPQHAIDINDRQVLIQLKCMKDISHDNMNAFLGICPEASHACVLMAYAARGSLQNVLLDENNSLSWDFKLSLTTDIAYGMRYLHSHIGYHGHLTSRNCVVDSRWISKITDYGLNHIRQLGTPEFENHEEYLWTAPEILRITLNKGNLQAMTPNFIQKGDGYSFGIICQEIILQNVPYGNATISAQEIVNRVAGAAIPLMRPSLDASCPAKWKTLMNSCWNENPEERPNFQKIVSMIRDLNGGNDIILVDNMINRLEEYTKHLEDIVTERTTELASEKARTEQLVLELLPRSIMEKLKSGQPVPPETHDSITVFFSDVVSFTRISAAGTPLDVVMMLNLMYTLFDAISTKFDVYKVATIGDAYLVASGVPVSNEDRHAAEIGKLALALLEAISNLQIPHLPDETLKLRIGLHSGSCVAGVAGIKMPRYLLFGDTIDIASRMESEGESMRIHVSPVTAKLLQKDTGFVLKSREMMQIKGLGTVETFWLLGNKT